MIKTTKIVSKMLYYFLVTSTVIIKFYSISLHNNNNKKLSEVMLVQVQALTLHNFQFYQSCLNESKLK